MIRLLEFYSFNLIFIKIKFYSFYKIKFYFIREFILLLLKNIFNFLSLLTIYSLKLKLLKMFTFSAMDLLVHNTMKNAAKCDKSCDKQFWNMNCLNVWYLFYSFEWKRYFFEKSFFLFILQKDKLFIRFYKGLMK